MASQKINTRNIVLILMIVVAAGLRLVSYKFPLLSNFTPVGAMALVGGAYFTDKWKAYVVVLLALFISDIGINYLYTSKLILWNSGSLYVYMCFAIMVLIGTLIKKVNVGSVLVASLASVAVHWLIIDMPFLYGNYYTHDWAGYAKSLTLALPFERNMVMADVIYGALLFGGFELAKSKFSVLESKKQMAI